LSNRILVVGAGPSLKQNLDDLERLGPFDGTIIATDASIQHLLGRGIIPTVGACLEDLHQLTKYFVPDIVVEKGHLIEKCWISDRVHGQVRASMKAAQIPFEVAAKVRTIGTSNVGLFSTAIGHLIYESNEIHYVGMDHCYPANSPPPVPKSDPLYELGFYEILNPITDETLVLNPAHELWREELHENLKLWPKLNIINHTGYGALFGKQIKWQPLKDLQEWKESYL
jgi:hypothetical protein